MGEANLAEFVGRCDQVGDWNDDYNSGSAKFGGTWYSIKDKEAWGRLREGESFSIGWRPVQKPASAGGGPGKPRIETVGGGSPGGASAGTQATQTGQPQLAEGRITEAQRQKSIELQTITAALAPKYAGASEAAKAVNAFWKAVFASPAEQFVDAAKESLDAVEVPDDLGDGDEDIPFD